MKNNIFDFYLKDTAGFDMFDQMEDVYEEFQKARELGCIPQKLKAPLFGMWEITSRCPQNCIYCYNSSPRKVEELTSKKMFEVADQILDSNMFSICITGGEPTMRKEYFELIRYLSTGGIQVGTVLSGANLTKQSIKKVAMCAGNVQVSLDGSTAEIHDRVRRRNGSYDDVINAIKSFVAEGVMVKVSFASTKYNIDDFENVYNLCMDLGVSELRTQKLAVSGKVKGKEEDICASSEQYNKLLEFIGKHKGKNDIVRYGDPSLHITNGLKMGIVLMSRITAEGNVGITPYADIFFGNVKENSLSDIFDKMANGWNDQLIKQYLAEGMITTEDEIIRDMLPEKIYIGGKN